MNRDAAYCKGRSGFRPGREKTLKDSCRKLHGHAPFFFSLILLIFLFFPAHAPANTDAADQPTTRVANQVCPDLFITAEDLQKKLERKSPITLVDIRSREEFDQARIPGSLNIPLHFIRTKAFLKSSRIVIVTEGYQYARLEPECKRLEQQGFMASILFGGLNTWKQANLPMEGEAWAHKAFDLIGPEEFHPEKGCDLWVVLDATSDSALEPILPSAVRCDGKSAFTSSRVKKTMKEKGEAGPFLVLIVNDDGRDLTGISRAASKAGLRNVFYLQGGARAYRQHLQNIALSKEPREKRVQKIEKCPTCGGQS